MVMRAKLRDGVVPKARAARGVAVARRRRKEDMVDGFLVSGLCASLGICDIVLVGGREGRCAGCSDDCKLTPLRSHLQAQNVPQSRPRRAADGGCISVAESLIKHEKWSIMRLVSTWSKLLSGLGQLRLLQQLHHLHEP